MRYVFVNSNGRIQVSVSKYSTEQKFLLETEHIMGKNRIFQATSDDKVSETILKIRGIMYCDPTRPVC